MSIATIKCIKCDICHKQEVLIGGPMPMSALRLMAEQKGWAKRSKPEAVGQCSPYKDPYEDICPECKELVEA